MSVPKASFEIVGDRLKFFNRFAPITKAVAFWPSGHQIRILSKTTIPDDHLRMDLMLENAIEVETCADVLGRAKLPCYDISDEPYTSHFEISCNQIQQILVSTEPILLKINPDQLGQIYAIAAQARVVSSGSKAAEFLDKKIHGIKRANLRELGLSLSHACLDKGAISDEMAINWGTSIEALNKLRADENGSEYLTADELTTVHEHFPSTDAPAEAPDPHETQLIEIDPDGNRTVSTAVLITDKGKQALFYRALAYQESCE